MKQKFLILLTMGSFLFLSGCYPDGADYTEEYDIVYTVYDEGYNFQNATTYSLPDQIVILGDDEDSPDFIPDLYAVPILANIDAHLQALGWSKVSNESSPDVQVMPASWTTTTISYWGGGYWCYWDPYYCSGGGWYYPYPIVSSYTTGTFLVNMIDNVTPTTDGKRTVVWNAAMNGLFQGSFDGDRIDAAIDQAFEQSPYLQTN